MDGKQTVRRFVGEAVNAGRGGAFRRSFSRHAQDLLKLVAEGDRVVARFACSATHSGDWRRHPPTGRRFEGVDEVYFFTFDGDRISAVWGVEDTLERFCQLGLDPAAG